jgi:hypothetical protein
MKTIPHGSTNGHIVHAQMYHPAYSNGGGADRQLLKSLGEIVTHEVKVSGPVIHRCGEARV